MEYSIPEQDDQRRAVLNLLTDLKSKDVPIHALGIQSHLLTRYPFCATQFRQFLQEVADLGLKIMLTELDVTDSQLPADPHSRDQAVADIYEEYLSVALDEPAVTAVTTWGLSDRASWLNKAAPRADGLPVRPLPLDENMNRKAAWWAIARAFDAAPKRSDPG
jgi:endo-1,4-beta-xylanase